MRYALCTLGLRRPGGAGPARFVTPDPSSTRIAGPSGPRRRGGAARAGSQVGGKEPRDAIAELDRQAAAVDIREGDRLGVLHFPPDQLIERGREGGAVAFEVELEVQPQAARVPVGRA